jgi:TonB family protein
MRVHLAIIFSAICSSALAEQTPETTTATAIHSIGRPHVCNSYYPPAAVRAGAEGTVLLGFIVTAKGGVSDIKILTSSGNKDLDDAAVNCASHWLYKPATKDAVPVDTPWKANVVWKFALPPAVQTALSCLYHREQLVPPPNLGQTVVNFRVMQDGSVTDAKVAQSSGDRFFDAMGMGCAQARHFDMSALTLPGDGLPGHLEMDWAGALASLSNTAVPPQSPNAASGSK